MNSMSRFVDVSLLANIPNLLFKKPAIRDSSNGGLALHRLFENSESYSIFLNLVGIQEKDIGIRLSESKREVSVVVKTEDRLAKQGVFWVFGVPAGGLLELATTRYRAGVLEIMIPKYNVKSVA